MKLTWRCVVPARSARSSWLTARRPRHCRSSVANVLEPDGEAVTVPFYPVRVGPAIPCRVLPSVAAARTVRRMHPDDPIAQTTELIDRYVAMWNEPDADERRRLIDTLWTDDARHVLAAPAEMIQAARAIGFPTVALEVRGHRALEFRVATAYAEFVAPGLHRFRSRAGGARLGDLVKFSWEMVATGTDVVVAVGTEVLQVDAAGRISVDHQFIDA